MFAALHNSAKVWVAASKVQSWEKCNYRQLKLET
jgi:hypothetical protein